MCRIARRTGREKKHVNDTSITLQEELYRRSLNEQFGKVREIKPRLLSEQPDSSDIASFVSEYRALENVYENEVKPDLEV